MKKISKIFIPIIIACLIAANICCCAVKSAFAHLADKQLSHHQMSLDHSCCNKSPVKNSPDHKSCSCNHAITSSQAEQFADLTSLNLTVLKYLHFSQIVLKIASSPFDPLTQSEKLPGQNFPPLPNYLRNCVLRI